MNQYIKYFSSGWMPSVNFFGQSDRGLAKKIEKYASKNQLRVEQISYGVSSHSMHALVVFVPGTTRA